SRGEGVSPRVMCLWRHPTPRPSPRKSGERERKDRARPPPLQTVLRAVTLRPTPSRAAAMLTQYILIPVFVLVVRTFVLLYAARRRASDARRDGLLVDPFDVLFYV